MTGEPKEKTEPWIEQHGVNYAYGYLTKDAMTPFMQALGMRGYPSAALVDAKGTVVWTGHPASVNAGLVKKHLKGASKTPVDVRAVTRAWPDEAKHVRVAFAGGKIAKALEIAKQLPEEWSVAADVQRSIDKRVAKLQARYQAGDYLAFTQGVKTAARAMSGLPELADLQATLAEVQRDASAKKVISGQKKLAKLRAGMSELRKASDAEKLQGKLEKLSNKHPGTIVSREADKLVARLGKMLRR